MTRLERTLERELRQIADRATPSPDAWESIRTRIADQGPHQETEIIMLTENTTPTRRWPLVAAAAAVVALAVAGVALVNRADDVEEPAEPPAPTVAPETTLPATTTTEAAAPGASALPLPGAALEPGRYTSDSLGVPIAFDLDVGETAAWTIMKNEPGSIWLISDGSDQELLAIGRLGSWYDPTQARTENVTGLGSIPPDDIDGWMVRNSVIVVDGDEVEIGGRPAEYRRFRLDTTPGATGDFCGSSAPCLWAATGSADVVGGTADPLEVGLDREQSIWVIDMGEFEPVYVFAAARLGADADQQWFADVVQPIVDSMTFGDPAPAVDGGTARVPERITVTAEMVVTQTGEPNLEEPWPIERTGTIAGDIDGTIVGTGVSSPNNAEVTVDLVMDVTIDGLGSGTLTLLSLQTWSGDGYIVATDHVVGGTGDLEGVTGFGTTRHTESFPGGAGFSATIELHLAPPAD
jgi:hypothetical protein